MQPKQLTRDQWARDVYPRCPYRGDFPVQMKVGGELQSNYLDEACDHEDNRHMADLCGYRFCPFVDPATAEKEG